ncbi:MAG: D-alanyl-D-alanine carboxypeptidase [Ruminococcaceae bacterium]|nr:D-alanyl-D-alanine carboxypeptidase [Oscillospiraceae bacterium]
MMKKIIMRASAMLMVLVLAFGVLTIIPQTKAEAAFVVDYEPHCDAIYMVNLDTGMVVYEKNSDKLKYPASLTKMMTCILALEYFSDPKSEYLTIKEAVLNDRTCINNGVWSTGYFKAGERVTLKDLLYCAMLPSDNYAALAIAYYVSEQKGEGTVEWFVDLMNRKAREIGCTNTQFMNPHGLFHEKHQTTAQDLYKIARYAMSNAAFAEIVKEPVYRRAATNMNPDFGPQGARIENTNKMLSTAYEEYFYQYVKGIKTGFLAKAGHCFASYATKDGYSYIIICLDDKAKKNNETNYAMLDAKTLFQWAFSSLDLKEIVSSSKPVATIDIAMAWGRDTIDVYPAESFTTLMPSNVESYSVMVKTNIADGVKAPVKKGEILGQADLIYGSEVIGTIDLVAGETVQRSDLLYVLGMITGLFESPVFIVFLALIVLAAVAYVVLYMLRSRSTASLRRVHRYRRM